ncbi:MAG TPA: hypothetical protein ENI87_02725 [bacterium]|nr:hypothetical protein [bacterium]
MSRIVPILSAVCVAGIGLTAWSRLAANGTEIDIPTRARQPNEPATAPEQALAAARRSCEMPPLDAIVTRLGAAAEAQPDKAESWHLLAEALLLRAQQRTHLRGIAVGRPVFAELPTAQQSDLERGLRAVATARELGDDSGDLDRIEAGLMSQRITGWASALQWNGRIAQALERAAGKTPDDPDLHVALGLRKLLAPRLLGHDPEKALEHFTFAARARADDERPAVFAGMACYLQRKRQLAITWLETAVARNPNNTFAKVVLSRLRRGEEAPFARDVTDEEAAAVR